MEKQIIHYTQPAVKCDSDELWEGRSLLYAALQRDGTPRARSYSRNVVRITLNEETPLYWEIDAPALHRRQYFSREVAEKVARPVVAFLKANGVNVACENPFPVRDQPWAPGNLVRVFTDGSFCDPYASDLPTIAMLPNMRRQIWELVRYPEDKPQI